MAKKSCKKGYYYCNTAKKCKKIPKGWHIMSSTGYLMRDNDHKDDHKDDTEGKKNNGNGNGSNGNGNGNGGSDGGSDGGGVSESKDHEVAMAQSQLKKSARNISKLRKALGKKEKDIPAWMQAKITDTAHDTDAAAGYADKMDEEVIAEKRDGKSAKSKGYSLRDWFKGGGWVQAGGKYDGKPCAKQPGQKTKPFCRDADDRANMSKKERSRRAAKKRKEDPNANRTGKANMVSASYSNWKQDLNQLDEFIGGQPGDGYIGHPRLDIKNPLNPPKKKTKVAPKNTGLAGRLGNRATEIERMLGNSYQPEGEVVTERDAWGTGPRDFIKMGGKGGLKTDQDIERERLQRLKNMKPGVKLDKAHYEPEGDLVDEGKKDACYHKVKSRYSVWPSAYASGALVKCRKKGAANWGNKTKKESYEISNWRDDFHATEVESVDLISNKPLQPTQGLGSNMLDEKAIPMPEYKPKGTKKSAPMPEYKPKGTKKSVPMPNYQYTDGKFVREDLLGETKSKQDKLEKISKQLVGASKMHAKQSKQVAKVAANLDEKCWKGYKKKGMKTMFGKRYPNCVKAHFSDWRSDMDLQEKEFKFHKMYDPKTGKGYDAETEKDHLRMKKMGYTHEKSEKKNCGCGKDPCKTYGKQEVKEDWQKSNRKDGVDGMSQKSVNAYKRANPGSKLKTAVTGKVKKGSKDSKRRKSFCARSNGQRKMHNIDCSKTPDKKICKARKRWRC